MAVGTEDERSTAELVRALGEQSSRLVRDELELAKAELAQKGKRAGIGAGAFGAGGVLALYGVGLLLTAAVAALATTLDTWLAALVVAAVVLVVAGVCALVGKAQVAKAVPPAPEAALASVKTDVDVVKDRAHDGRATA